MVLLIGVVALIIDVQFFYRRSFEAPLPRVSASTDSAVIARGAYLVNGPGRCADCHGAVAQRPRMHAGDVVPLSGGFSERIFLGDIIFPNITPDPDTGIGEITDGELARFIRTGIDHRGEYGLPFMEYGRLSPADLTAVISYLRSTDPVVNEVPRSRYNFLGKFALAYFIRPEEQEPIFPDAIRTGTPVERGRYLAEAVGSCAGCHTNRSLTTGRFLGERYAGGLRFEHPDDPEQVVVSPSLRPDERGRIAGFTEEEFVERIQTGTLRDWSPMSWGPYSRMTPEDARALYRYLLSLGSATEP